MLPFIVIGVVTGSVYGLAGVGLVLTYKTSGIFNFAYGSIAALSVFIFYWLHTEHGWPWPLVAFLCVFVLAPIEGLLLELMARALEPVGAALKVVATIGLLLIVLGIGTVWFGTTETLFPQVLPTSTVRIAGAYVTWGQIIVVIVAIVATLALYLFLRYVRLGVTMRGVVDNPELVSMTGESPVRVRRWAWVVGTAFASMAGILLAPGLSLDATVITLLVVQAFGAAAIGYFSNLPLTFAGGLLIGIVSAIAQKYSVSNSWLAGVPSGLPFIMLFLVLIVTPKARLVERRVTLSLPVRKSWYAPTRVRLGAAAAVLIFLAFVPQFVGTNLIAWSAFLVDVILFLSLGLLVRKSGQISLCQFAFAAIGAAAFGHLVTDWHVPWLLAVFIAGLAAIPVGALIAIPAIRLSGVFLALATLGFGILIEQMVYLTRFMFGSGSSGIASPRPDVSIGSWNLRTDSGFYYLALLFAIGSVLLVMAIQRGRLGRMLGALADSPVALEAQGASTNVARVLVFCIAALMAAVSGALTASLYQFALGSNYSSLNSLSIVALVVIITAGDPWYAIMAALGFGIVPAYITISNINTYLQILFGVGAATYALQINKLPSVPVWLRTFLDRLGGRPPEAAPEAQAELALAASPAALQVRERPARRVASSAPLDGSPVVAGLEVEEVFVRFGGVVALQYVSCSAEMGRITGLIGPNGAGKTTLFNVCSGLVKPRAGRVRIHGVDVTHMSTASRARLGLGRTFQRARLFDSLSVRENIQIGREASFAGSNPLTQTFTRRSDRSVISTVVDEVVELTGIGPLLDLQAGLLPTGQRRLVELARTLAGPFDVLLLDEPSSGLDESETRRFGAILTDVVHERGTSIVLVEHDVSLVQRVCDHIFVLDFGKLIADGPPEIVLQSDVVKAAYLGEEPLEEPLEGPSLGAEHANVPQGN